MVLEDFMITFYSFYFFLLGQKNPAKIYSRVELKRDPRRTFNAIRKITKCGGYRKDLSTVCSSSYQFWGNCFKQILFIE